MLNWDDEPAMPAAKTASASAAPRHGASVAPHPAVVMGAVTHPAAVPPVPAPEEFRLKPTQSRPGNISGLPRFSPTQRISE